MARRPAAPLEPPSLTVADIRRAAAAPATRPIALWLIACCALIFAMVVIGGITRLTESGLSIAEWRPISGLLPPLSQAEWDRVFALYRQTPQYQLVNHGIGLEAFKSIFWWEYLHRLWGRLIGVAFALPLVLFWIGGRIPRALLPRLVLLLGLGGLQGVLGWYMVKSGLADRIDVSQYRLTAHLALALALYVAMLWTALSLLRPAPVALPPAAVGLARHLRAVAALVALTMTMGGFVAGLKAGFIYNSFPLMGGRLLPDDALSLSPAWVNLFENPAFAQFVHRWLAIATVATVLWLWAKSRRVTLPPAARLPLDLLAVMALLQAGLGIATLLLVVPIPLAAAHQAGAVLLLTLTVLALHGLRAAPRPPRSPFYNRRGAG
jgi:cytochrome c oxidase assembly protein subunit 15